MREIKFRGRRIDTEEWVYGYYFLSPLTQENYEKEDAKYSTRIYGNSIARAESSRDCTMLKLAEWVQGSENPSIIIGNIKENPELLEVNK